MALESLSALLQVKPGHPYHTGIPATIRYRFRLWLFYITANQPMAKAIDYRTYLGYSSGVSSK